jgi:hypothetical protein
MLRAPPPLKLRSPSLAKKFAKKFAKKSGTR